MKKILLLSLSVILLGSCAYNSRETNITIFSGSDTDIDASGATNTTDTGQMPQADLTPLVEAAQAAIGGKASSIVDKITDMIGDDEKSEPEALEDGVNIDTGAAVSPAGDIEEVD